MGWWMGGVRWLGSGILGYPSSNKDGFAADCSAGLNCTLLEPIARDLEREDCEILPMFRSFLGHFIICRRLRLLFCESIIIKINLLHTLTSLAQTPSHFSTKS